MDLWWSALVFPPTTRTMPNAPRILPVLAAVPYLSAVAAYSFNIVNTPRQCQNLTVEITGQGRPPYSLLLVPTGPTPLPNAVEARRITNVPFNGTTGSLSFQLRFPENSQFIAVVSARASLPYLHSPGILEDVCGG